MPPKKYKFKIFGGTTYKCFQKIKLGTKNIRVDICQLTDGNKVYFLVFMESSFICGVLIISH